MNLQSPFLLAVFLSASLLIAEPPRPEYELAFADEFSGTTLDLEHWHYRGNRKGGTNADDAVTLKDGDLVITYSSENGKLKGGGAITNVAFGYGYYETRAKLFGGTGGLHSSFWTTGLGGDGITRPVIGSSFEIDIFECDSNAPHSLPPNFHYWLGKHFVPRKTFVVDPKTRIPLYRTLVQAHQDYFVAGCEYLPDRLIWYLNGTKIAEYKNPAMTGRTHVFLTALAGYKPAGIPDPAKLPGESRWDYFRFYTIKLKGENLIVNPSFDDNNRKTYDPEFNTRLDHPVSWLEPKQQEAVNVDDKILRTGTGALRLGMDGKYDTAAEQALRYIPNGTYKLQAYIRNPENVKTQLYANDKILDIPKTDDFTLFTIDDINIEHGFARCGIRAIGQDSFVHIDDVSFACNQGTEEFNRKKPLDPFEYDWNYQDDNVALEGKWLGSSLWGYRNHALYSSDENASITWKMKATKSGVAIPKIFLVTHHESTKNALATLSVNDEIVQSAIIDLTQTPEETDEPWFEFKPIKLEKNDQVHVKMLRQTTPDGPGLQYLRAECAILDFQ